jgi:protein-disulfide isomerase
MLRILFAILLAVAPLSAARAQSGDVQKELSELKEGQRALQKELQEIKSLLKSRAPSSPIENKDVVIQIGNDPFKGLQSAPLTLVEFSDYQCPFCSRHTRDTLPQIEKEYVSTGKLRYVFRDAPIESIHKDAFKAAEAAHCAGEQGKYWEMHDSLFTNQKALAKDALPGYAEALGVTRAPFLACMESGRYAEGIKKDMAEAQQLGVSGTPTFFLGYTDPSGASVKTVKAMRGAQPYSAFKEAITGLLSPPSLVPQ